MGVKLASLLKGKQVTSADLQGKRFAIDTSHTLMQFLKRKYVNSSEIATDHTQRAIPHLYGVFYRTIRFLENSILPVFCFDGKSSKMKSRQTQVDLEEFKRVSKMHESMMRHELPEKAKNIALGHKFLWKNTIRETKQLLIAMGIPFLNSPSEGKTQCAQLVKMEVCDYVISSDFDVLLYGAPMVKIKEIVGKKIKATLYTFQEIQDSYGLNRFQLIDLSILIGNDYTPGIKGIGPTKGVSLLQKFKSLEGLPKSIIKDLPLSRSKIDAIRSLFIFPQVLNKNPPIFLAYPNRGGIREIMTVDHTFNSDRVDKGINRLKRAYEKTRKFHTQKSVLKIV